MAEAAYTVENYTDHVSGAPALRLVPNRAVTDALAGIPYNTFGDFGDLFKRENLREAFRVLRRVDPFPYQLEVADAVIYSCLNGLGWLFVVMQSRQSGKNEESAFIEQYLLLYGWYFRKPVSGIKFAPVHKPQIYTSMNRLEGSKDKGGLAGSAASRGKWKKSEGFKYHVGGKTEDNQWAFMSCAPTANIASCTARTCIETDETQDVDGPKWERDAGPMGVFYGATRVFYGVAWTKDTFIFGKVKEALEMEVQLAEKLGYRPKLLFFIDDEEVGKYNKHYREAVDAEILRLGPEHITILTQYKLKFIDSLDLFFRPDQVGRLLLNQFTMLTAPRPGFTYVAGLDAAGEDENATQLDQGPGTQRRDSTVLVIGEVQPDQRVVPVHIYFWTGKKQSQQRKEVEAKLKYWKVAGFSGDATGIGEALVSSCVDAVKRQAEVAEAYRFKDAGDENKSRLGYQVLSFIAEGRLQIPPVPLDGLKDLWAELLAQIIRLIRVAKKEQQINYYVPGTAKWPGRPDLPPTVNWPQRIDWVPHDDIVFALFLMIRAALLIRDPGYKKASAFTRTF